MFVLYVAGIVSALLVAWVMKQFAGVRALLAADARAARLPVAARRQPVVRPVGAREDLPEPRRRHHPRADDRVVVPVQLPGAAGRRDRARRSSTASPENSAQLLEYVFAPIGFNWQISIALVPGLAAREVAVGALGTVYAMSAAGDDVAGQLEPVIASTWSLATACSLLAWYVFAPQCLSTLAVVKRETNSWRYPHHHGGLPVRAGVPGLVHHLPRRRGLGVRFAT